ncbi:DNA-binding NarL/FixJ family response regulator [Oxalobacteraceae bacterium GrIS 2.11]
MTEKKTSILLVDDHEVVRNGIRLMLSTTSGLVVTGEASNSQEALRLIREQDFDVAIVDLGLPDKTGLELLKRMLAEKPRIAVLIFSMYAEEIYGIRAFKLGASGFLSKNSDVETVVEAVNKVATGGKFISAAMSDKLVKVFRGEKPVQHDTLTNRELEVLRMLAAGEPLIKIAANLNLSASTITTYRSRILVKTGLKNNVQLARYAADCNLV